MRLEWLPQALKDFDEIVDYIAEDNPAFTASGCLAGGTGLSACNQISTTPQVTEKRGLKCGVLVQVLR